MATAFAIVCALTLSSGTAAQASGQKLRPLTREEVLAAIQTTLRANGAPANETLRASDIQMPSEVDVIESTPRLRITQIQRSPSGETSRLLVWVASEPRVPPFWVRVDRRTDLDRWANTSKGGEKGAQTTRAPEQVAIMPVSEHSTRIETQARSQFNAVLVKAGDPVALVVEVGGLRIQGTGISLERGRSGDEVRVRAVPSGKIVMGTVVSDRTVQVSF